LLILIPYHPVDDMSGISVKRRAELLSAKVQLCCGGVRLGSQGVNKVVLQRASKDEIEVVFAADLGSLAEERAAGEPADPFSEPLLLFGRDGGGVRLGGQPVSE
jgi:hypothetical protein